MAAAFLPYVGLEEIVENKALTAKSLAAELLGTMFLVMIGCGSCLGGEADFVRIALAFGVTVATMAQSIGHISGCHVNPAITIGLFIARKIGLIKGVLYVICQCVGGVIGAGLLMVLVPEDEVGLGQTALSPKVNVGQGFGIEFFITFVLVLVVFAAAADENNTANVKGSAPLAIGLSITTCHLFAIPFTGSSMNPARSLGPAVILNEWENHWVYWAGPILGGVCAALVYQVAFKAPVTEVYSVVNQADKAGDA